MSTQFLSKWDTKINTLSTLALFGPMEKTLDCVSGSLLALSSKIIPDMLRRTFRGAGNQIRVNSKKIKNLMCCVISTISVLVCRNKHYQ